MVSMMEKFIKYCLKHNHGDTEPLEHTQDYIREFVVNYFMSYNISSKNDQVTQLKKFFDLSLRVIQKADQKSIKT